MDKKCSKCNVIKEDIEFYKDNTSKTGLESYCKKCRAEYNTRFRNKHVKTVQGKFVEIKRGARWRRIKFELTIDQVKDIITQPCSYCGKDTEALNGIDRVNSSLGYVDGNCVSCCRDCNIAKNSLTKEEFLKLVELIYKHSIEGMSPTTKN